ncbi:MAG: YwbE family protein [Thermoproteota archaeon]|nr:YwbE family protein [Thermoproteota archaeon]
MEGTFRDNIKIGCLVKVVQKGDQKTGDVTEGIVKKILTNSKSHPHGIKVLLETGIIGRVKEIVDVSKDKNM